MNVTCDNGSPLRRIRLSPSGSASGNQITVSSRGLMRISRFVREAEDDAHCRLIVLEATSGGFCHGMDLEAIVDGTAPDRRLGVRSYVRCLRALRESSRVIVALVDGAALGAGVGLAASADLVYATETSRFGLPEVVLGLVPAIVLSTLLDRMPIAKARRLALAGSSISARDARSDGLVDRVVSSSAELESALCVTARQIRRTEPAATASLKELCRRLPALDRDEALEEGARRTQELLSVPQLRDAIREFIRSGTLPCALESTGGRR